MGKLPTFAQEEQFILLLYFVQNEPFFNQTEVFRGAPGKSGLHASGEGERVIAPEPW